MTRSFPEEDLHVLGVGSSAKRDECMNDVVETLCLNAKTIVLERRRQRKMLVCTLNLFELCVLTY